MRRLSDTPRATLAEVGAVVLGAVMAVAVWALAPTYPGYDAYFHLLWGRELMGGDPPTYAAFAAPTPHPLYVAVSALLSLAGQFAERLMVLLGGLSLVALLWGSFRLGAATVGRWPAVLGVVILGSSTVMLLLAARAFVDVPFLALVVWAASLEARAAGRDRSMAVVVLLAVAGLLRPEGWVFAAAYLVWKARVLPGRELAVRAGVAAVAPALWAIGDAWATGDPLFSFTGTRELAEEIGRTTGIGAVPRETVSGLADLIRAPAVAAGIAGLATAVSLGAGRRAALPAALVALALVTFAATGLAGLALQPRYLGPAAVGLALLAGYAVLGFTTLPDGHPARRPWSRLAALAAVAGAVVAATQVGAVSRAAEELRFSHDVHRDLVALVADGRVREGMACGPLSFPTERLVPDTRWILDPPPGTVLSRAELRPQAGVEVTVPEGRSRERLGQADGVPPETNEPDPGFEPVGRVGRFAIAIRCP